MLYSVINCSCHAVCYIPRTSFITGSSYLFTPFTHLTYPQPLSLAITSLFFVSMSWWVFFWFCFVCFSDSTFKWDHMKFVFLWLIFKLVCLSCYYWLVTILYNILDTGPVSDMWYIKIFFQSMSYWKLTKAMMILCIY